MHQVGAGVLGPVFRGYDPEQDRAVAIKAFALDLTPEQARALAADLGHLPNLSLRHPSIIAPYAAGWEGSTAYLVEEYFVAESADVALKQYGPAPVPDAMRLIGQLAGALDFAAAAGVHHGALHPRDILVAPHEVRLSGLGIVEALERVGYRPPARRPYAAPERAAGAPFGSAADVFSLACVAYELLTGRRPAVQGANVSVECDAIPAADRAALGEVFARALSAQPDDRHGSALSFAASLKHALTGEPLVTGEQSERPRTRRAPRAVKKDGPPPARPPDSENEADQPAGGVLPLIDRAEAPPTEPGPDATPLPAFLETYRPPMEAGSSEPRTELPAAPASFQGPTESTDRSDDSPHSAAAGSEQDAAAAEPQPTLAPELPTFVEPIERVPPGDGAPTQSSPIDFDLQPFDRADALPGPPPSTPEEVIVADREPASTLDDFDHRVERTKEIRVVHPKSPAPHEPGEDGPLQPPLGLDESFETVPPRREPVAAEMPAPAAASEHRTSRIGAASLVGMLLIGFLLGIPAGYMMAPKASPAPAADAQKPVEQPDPTATPAAATTVPQIASPAPAPAAQAPVPVPPVRAETTTPPETAGGSTATRAAKPVQKPAPRSAARQQPAKADAAQQQRAAATATGQAAKPAPSATRQTFEGSLVIASKPSGANVSIDGRPVGTTPLTMKSLTAGSHAVRLELAGYVVWSSSVQVTAGKVNRVTASLERRPGG